MSTLRRNIEVCFLVISIEVILYYVFFSPFTIYENSRVEILMYNAFYFRIFLKILK